MYRGSYNECRVCLEDKWNILDHNKLLNKKLNWFLNIDTGTNFLYAIYHLMDLKVKYLFNYSKTIIIFPAFILIYQLSWISVWFTAKVKWTWRKKLIERYFIGQYQVVRIRKYVISNYSFITDFCYIWVS